jgi:RNA polymerase sigma-70 factor (ECF subfamily)
MPCDEISPSELDLQMARLADGDRSVFTVIYETLWPHVFLLCKAQLNHEADAADAAQSALTRIFSRAADYNVRRPALPWALAIAARECKKFICKEQGRVTGVELDRIAARTDVDAEHEERRLITAVLSAIQSLSDLDREALIATYWAESSGASGSTLRKRRARALSRLRAALWRLYGSD